MVAVKFSNEVKMSLSHRTTMAPTFPIALLMLLSSWAVAQKPPHTAQPHSATINQTAEKNASKTKPEQDPVIAQIIKNVSPQRIQQTIEKLVSFGTRHTLSVNNPGAATSGQGIVAARNWIKSEF